MYKSQTYHIIVLFWKQPGDSYYTDCLTNIWEGLQDCLHTWLPLSGWRRFVQQDWDIGRPGVIVKLNYEKNMNM